MRPFSLEQLLEALPHAWNEQTRGKDKSPRSDSDSIVAGQCIVTSLLIKRHFGGEIIQCRVGGESYRQVTHYFNELDGGIMIDATRGQFNKRSPYRLFKTAPKESEYIFNGDGTVLGTWDRVDLLESRVIEYLSWTG